MANDQFGLLTLFADGGFMMYPLVLCSLIALGVMIAKFWTLWAAHKDTETVLSEVDELARAGDIDGAIAAAGSKRGPASAILMAGLRRIKGREVGEGEIEQAVSTVGTIELGFLERGLVVLATIANVAPLMGFLGTVAGMILAFASIEAAGSVDPALVAGGNQGGAPHHRIRARDCDSGQHRIQLLRHAHRQADRRYGAGNAGDPERHLGSGERRPADRGRQGSDHCALPAPAESLTRA